MAKNKKVSIIITVVKNRGWLDECIKSALSQDFEDYEIILASDENPEMKKYADKYGLRFSLCENGDCLSKNFNRAVRMAKGEFIKVLADDDLLTPNCLKDLVNNIGDNPLIHADAINFWENSIFKYIINVINILIKWRNIRLTLSYIRGGLIKLKEKRKEILSKPHMGASLSELMTLRSSYIHGGTILFKKDVFLKYGGYDENLKCCEDYDFYLNLLSRGFKFSYVDKVVYRYRKHRKQKSKFPNSPSRERAKRYIFKKIQMSRKMNGLP